MNTSISLSRRALLGGTAGIAGASLLSACGGSGGPGAGGDLTQPEGNVPEQFKDRTRVVFWAAYPQYLKKPFEKLVGGFNESQKDIYVDIQFQPDYPAVVQQLIRGLKAKQAPDIALFDVPLWQRFVADGVLEPLDDYFSKADLQRTDYVDAFIAEGVKEDKLWWIPFNRSTPLLYFNKDVFAKAGAPENGPTTWSELREISAALQKVKVKGRKLKAHAMQGASHNWVFSGMAHAWEGNLSDGLDVTINQGGSLEAASWMRDYIFKDKHAYQTNDVTVDFINGVTATAIQTTGQLSQIGTDATFDVGVAFCPKEKAPGTPTGGAGMSILAGIAQDRKDAAFEFMKYAGQPEMAATWSVDTGYLPVTKKAVETKTLQDFIAKNPNFGVATQQLEVAKSMDDILTQVPGTQAVVNTGLEKIYGENADTQTTLDGVAKELDQLAQPVREKQ